MPGERYGVLFGELRSLLSGEANNERFQAVVLVLSGLRREAPERFEAEVLPYASAGLERWYVGAAPLEFAVTGRVAVEALRADVSWLRVVRALDLHKEQEVGAALDALLACTQLARLEALTPPERLPSEGLRRLAESPLMSQLTTLQLRHRTITHELEAWAARPPERLCALDIKFCALDARSVAPLLALSGQLERLGLDFTTMVGLERLLREGSWSALRELSLPEEMQRAGCEALAALTRRCALERLEVRRVRWPADAADALWREAGLAGLKQLIVTTAYGEERLPLDALLSGPMGASLETLALKGARLASDAAPGACPRLAAVKLDEVTRAALGWFLAHELPALRALTLESMQTESLAAAMTLLGGSSLRLDKLALWLERDQINDAALSALLWRAVGAMDLEELSLFTLLTPMEALAAALMRDTIEQMPHLKSFYISPDALSPDAREALRGSRAGAMLGL